MRVTIRQNKIKITPALSKYIEMKVVRPVRRFLKETADSALPIFDLEFGRTTRHHKKGNVYRAEANLHIGKRVFRAEAEAQDIRAACDILEEELKRELRSFKGKVSAVARRQERRTKRELRLDPAARPYNKKGRVRNEAQ